MSQPTPRFRIHTCEFCSAQEIDPLTRKRGTQRSTVKYRGSRVYDGASRGCEFFQAIFAELITKLENGFHHQFQHDQWMYELSVHVPRNHDSNLASAIWRNTADGVFHSTESFGILALPGKKQLYLPELTVLGN
jgi:hypothetical protein